MKTRSGGQESGDIPKSASPARIVEIHATDAEHAPFVFFDAAPIFGAADGTIRITLIANRAIPDGSVVRNENVIVGYLRCGLLAAADLRNNLDKALLLAAPTDGKSQ